MTVSISASGVPHVRARRKVHRTVKQHDQPPRPRSRKRRKANADLLREAATGL